MVNRRKRYETEKGDALMKPIFLVSDFGAVANSEGIQTAFFQAALDAARDVGGGKVVVPSGIFTVLRK